MSFDSKAVEVRNIDTCYDFIGVPLNVGDHVAVASSSAAILYQITEIQVRQPENSRKAYALCHLKLAHKTKNHYIPHEKARRGTGLMKVHPDYVMLYKLSQ